MQAYENGNGRLNIKIRLSDAAANGSSLNVANSYGPANVGSSNNHSNSMDKNTEPDEHLHHHALMEHDHYEQANQAILKSKEEWMMN